MTLLIGALVVLAFVAGAVVQTWRLRRYWQQLQAKEKFLDTRDKQKPPASTDVEKYTGVFGIEGTVVVIQHDVIVDQGDIMVPTWGSGGGGGTYAFRGPMRRRHQLLLEEIIEPPPATEEDPVELEATEDALIDDWDPDDYYEETDGDDD